MPGTEQDFVAGQTLDIKARLQQIEEHLNAIERLVLNLLQLVERTTARSDVRRPDVERLPFI